VNRNQENAAAVKAVEARLEEMDERHLNFAEGDGFDSHVSKFQSFRVSETQGTFRGSYVETLKL